MDSWCLRGFFLVGGSFSARVCEVGWFRQSGNFFRQVRFPRDGVSVFLAQVDESAIFGGQMPWKNEANFAETK